jgi:large subunit ribosomal protein L18
MNKEQKIRNKNRVLRSNKSRVKAKRSALPRLCVNRTLRHINAQIILGQKTICSSCDCILKDIKDKKPLEVAALVGKDLAKKAIEKKVESVVFDRSYYKFHGRVKALADAAREVGLKF